jgi:hypothetical protein
MDQQDHRNHSPNLPPTGLNGTRPGDDPARSLPFRSEPLSCVVTHERLPGMETTSIARLFDPADVPRCRRCQECRATPLGLCLVTVPEIIPDGSARLFSLTDWRRSRGLG